MSSLEPFKRLVKLTARAFYDDDVPFKSQHHQKSINTRGIAVVVLDALTRRLWVREEDLAKDLKLQGKLLRRCFHFLEMEKFIMREHRKESAQGFKNHGDAVAFTAHGQPVRNKEGEEKVRLRTESYCCLDYPQIYDVVRYRIHHMRKRLKKEFDKENTVQEYICRNCSKRYNDFDAARLILLETGGFHCEICKHELVKEAYKNGAQAAEKDSVKRLHAKMDSMLERLNVQLKPLMEQLNRIQNLDVPDFGNLRDWEARSGAAARNGNCCSSDPSRLYQGYGAASTPYLWDTEVEVNLTGNDVKDEDTKSETKVQKVQPPWMIEEEMRHTKEQCGEKPKASVENNPYVDLKDDKKAGISIEDQRKLQDEYIKAYYDKYISMLEQQRVVNDESGPTNENSYDRQVGLKSKRVEDLEEDVEWVEEVPCQGGTCQRC